MKLDRLKDAEYKAEVARAAEWDTSTWTRWNVVGRVLPERCDVNVAATTSQGIGAGGRFRIRLQVTRSHISALCAFEEAKPSVFQISDAVRSALAFPVDYIAFSNRGAYDVVLDVCINLQTGEAWPIPIFEPIFRDSDRAGLCFDPEAVSSSNFNMPWTAAREPGLPTALHDLTQAVAYPRRTFEYCRMAIEAVRQFFDPALMKGQNNRHAEGEKATCAALNIARKSLTSLDRVAARSRHGDLIVSIDWPIRTRALELAWEVVARFSAHLEGQAQEDWKLLDVRVEE